MSRYFLSRAELVVKAAKFPHVVSWILLLMFWKLIFMFF
jgi:hypothetical protein